MSAGEAGSQQQAEAIIDLGPQIGDHQDREGGHQAVLDHLRHHLIGQVRAHAGHVSLGAALVHREAVDADRSKDDHNQHTGIRADGIGHGQKSREYIAECQPHKAGQHTGRNEEALDKAYLRAEKLSDHDEYRRNCEIHQKVID